MIRRFFASVLCVLLLLSSTCSVTATETAEDNYVLLNCENFMLQDQEKKLTSDHYYNYETFVDSLSDGSDASIAINQMMTMSDMLLDVSYQPSTDDYIESISTMIALMDADSVYDTADQKSLDNLQTGADYLLDVKDIICDAISVVPSKYTNLNQEAIADAIDNLNSVANSTEDAIKMLSNLEVAMDSYAKYDQLLSDIEANSSGELKEAAQIMRKSLGDLASYTLESYTDWAMDSGENVVTSIFDFLELQQVDDLKDLLPIDTLTKMSDIWQLEKDASLLAGNFLFGTENVADRTREMIALSDIADALTDDLAQKEKAFLRAQENGTATERMVQEYLNTINFLLSSRSRGEYCLYSMITEDSGILSMLFDTTDVENWYQDLLYFLYKMELRIDSITTDPSETILNVYMIFDGVAGSYQEAASFCESIGGHLATVSSAAENQYLYNFITTNGYDSAYIGLYEAGEGNWVWVTGEPVTFTFWGGKEPNNEGGDENYAMFYYKYGNGGWNDGDFGGNTIGNCVAFICEWEDVEAFVDFFEPSE